jgi:hypothetical protein
MDKRHMLFSLVAALGVAGAAGAQAQKPPTPDQPMPPSSSSSSSSDPSSASSPHQQDAMRTAAAAGRGAADAASGDVIGLEVISPSGNSLGTVVDTVKDPTGAPAYIVISSAKGNTVMPYPAAASMVHDNAVVVDQSKLNNAPKVEQGAWKDASSKSWRTESDRYWAKGNTDSKSATKSSKPDRG